MIWRRSGHNNLDEDGVGCLECEVLVSPEGGDGVLVAQTKHLGFRERHPLCHLGQRLPLGACTYLRETVITAVIHLLLTMAMTLLTLKGDMMMFPGCCLSKLYSRRPNTWQ